MQLYKIFKSFNIPYEFTEREWNERTGNFEEKENWSDMECVYTDSDDTVVHCAFETAGPYMGGDPAPILDPVKLEADGEKYVANGITFTDLTDEIHLKQFSFTKLGVKTGRANSENQLKREAKQVADQIVATEAMDR
jgi:hypothetical protein